MSNAFSIFKQRYNRLTYFAFVGIIAVFVGIAEYLGWDLGSGMSVVVLIAMANRFHDLGLSGWFAVGALILVNVAALAVLMNGGTEIAMGVIGSLFLLALFALGLISGENHPNKWGDPPPSGLQFQAAPDRSE